MRLQLLGSILACLLGALPSLAETPACTDGDLGRKALAEAQKVQRDFRNAERTPTASRSALAEFRQSETTCSGQVVLDYVIALHDVHYAELQPAIDALAIVLATEGEVHQGRGAITNLAARFVEAGEFQVALDLIRHGRAKFPDEDSLIPLEVLLLARAGHSEEAKIAGDALLAGSWDNPRPHLIPRAGWIRLAVSEMAGDSEDEASVIALLKQHVTGDVDLQLARDRAFATVALLLTEGYFQLSHPPHTKLPRPDYPRKMLAAGKSGTCDLHFDIDEKGRPRDVAAKCTDNGFADAAIEGLRKGSFRAAVVDGKAHRVLDVSYPMEFNLN